jgi:hypothetical protein
MKLLAMVSFAAFLAVTPIWAQSEHPQKPAKKPVSISGEVSSDGRTFTADSNRKSWQVSNPDALQGIYGRHVTIRGNLNSAKNGIEVLTIKAAGAEGTSAKLDDAAFRR